MAWNAPTTSWSTVVHASNPEDPLAKASLELLCRRYRKPVLELYLALERDRDRAEDMTQGFFAAVLAGNKFAEADRERGKFRNWLAHAAKTYRLDQWRRSGAHKRGGKAELVQQYTEQENAKVVPTPEDAFERAFEATVLGHAKERVRERMDKRGRLDRWCSPSSKVGHDRALRQGTPSRGSYPQKKSPCHARRSSPRKRPSTRFAGELAASSPRKRRSESSSKDFAATT